MVHFWGSHVTHLTESYGWGITQSCAHAPHPRVTHRNESCRTYEWVRPTHRAHENDSETQLCRTCESFMSHVRMCHTAHVNATCVVWLVWLKGLQVWLKGLLTIKCGNSDCVGAGDLDMPVTHSFICVTWLIHLCDMTHWYVCHDVLLEVICGTCECVMSHIRMSHVSHTNEARVNVSCLHTEHKKTIQRHTCDVVNTSQSCLTYKWVIPHIWMRHVGRVNVLCVHTEHKRIIQRHTYGAVNTNESCLTYEWVMSHIRMSHVSHTYEPCRTREYGRMNHAYANIKYLHQISRYEGATINRLPQIVGLFCKRAL